MAKITQGKGPSKKMMRQTPEPIVVEVEKVVEVPVEVIKEVEVIVEKPVEYQMVDVSSNLSQLLDEEVERLDNRVDEMMSELDALHNKVQKEDNAIRKEAQKASINADNATQDAKINKMKLNNHIMNYNQHQDVSKANDKELKKQIQFLQIACGATAFIAFIGWLL